MLACVFNIYILKYSCLKMNFPEYLHYQNIFIFHNLGEREISNYLGAAPYHMGQGAARVPSFTKVKLHPGSQSSSSLFPPPPPAAHNC